MKNVTRRIASTQSIALGAAWAIALIAQPAFAQQPIERVEITGSSIKRVDAETALPVQIVTRQEIEATGAANVEQFLQGLGVALQGNNNTVAASASPVGTVHTGAACSSDRSRSVNASADSSTVPRSARHTRAISCRMSVNPGRPPRDDGGKYVPP